MPREYPTTRTLSRLWRAYWVTYSILLRYLLIIPVSRLLMGETRRQILMEKVHRSTTRKIVKNILLLKGLYIKIGQTLSIMTNFLPRALTEGLEQLQDSVPPHPYDKIKHRFIHDFEKTPEQAFQGFEKEPIAAASLGQVHVAYLPDGTKLAVKLQYPEIDKIVQTDLKTIRSIFGILNFVFPHYGLKDVYAECAKMIEEELDFQLEGRNLERIRNNFKDLPDYTFPKIYWDYSSKKVLTAEFIEGTKVTHRETLEQAGIDPHGVAVSLIHSYCKQIFIDGVFHADPHPGNVIVQPPAQPNGTARIALVDFGATATISPQMKEGITFFIDGLIKKDTRILASAMKRMGFIAKEDNDEEFHKIVEYFYSKIRGVKIENFREINLSDFQSLSDILELKKMDISFRELTSSFHVPKDWILLERALLLVLGIVTHLDPKLNPIDIVIPYVEKFVLGENKTVADLILQSSKELLLSYIQLPTEINKTLKKLQEGRLSLTNKDQLASANRIYRGLHQLIFTLLLLASGTGAYLASASANQNAERYLIYSGLFWGLCLVVSLIRGK